MSVLKSLSFIAVTNTSKNPIVLRRSKLVDRLGEQKNLAENDGYVKSVRRWRVIDGERKQIEKSVRVRPWWFLDATGNIVFRVSYGTKALEFEKGKAGIAVSSKDKLVGVIETLIKATQAGELDGLLSQVAGQQPIPKIRRTG